jgi:YggT family protein
VNGVLASVWVLAVDNGDVARYVNNLFSVYIALLIARIVLSWIPRLPFNPVLRAVTGFVEDVSDPYLNVFRRFIPPVRMGPAALDLSPIVGIFMLIILQGVIVALIGS